ncbi:hypothetical protein V0U79_12705 [Hyphobacterium sp. HN65]|uniref:Lipoprotein n=1 Tax=Hyphobacterium lacteum TaxID=3116575 RepID=A0ABU7LTH4_9PROT|nr:hypothetical protein [Hyphobacterium sp. HN65]MEE2527225.1 hypothetical protein [Hyphobacterium sp. HN65]
MRPLLIVAITSTLVACASTPTTYAPAAGTNRGYSEQQIEADRYRVRFDGGSDVTFSELEDMAFRRAAELTLEQGGSWFIVVSRSSQGDDDRPVSVGGSVGQTFGSRRFSGSSVGIGIHLDPSAGEKSIFLEILIRSGAMPDRPDAYNAQDVLHWQN